jgi:transcriptional regulator with XRE-family HTH domain
MNQSFNARIAHNIRKLRELKNFTQEHVAHELSITVTAYGKIERGETEISLSRIQAIANIFEIDHLRIFTFDEQSVLMPVKTGYTNEIAEHEKDSPAEVLIQQLREENKFLKERNERLMEMLGKKI